MDEIEALRRWARAAKGAAAAMQAQADALGAVAVEAKALHQRLTRPCPPRSWEVERHAFLVRHTGSHPER